MLFEPSDEDMRIDYPELNEYDEFKELNARELRLCWLLGNKTSPLVRQNLPKKVLLKSAIEQAYSKKALNSRPDLKEMMSGTIPDKILLGTKRMAAFSVSQRLRAHMMNEYVFDRLEELIMLSEDEKATFDIDDKKKYADLAIKISSELTGVVQRVESGFGIKRKKERKKTGNQVKASIKQIQP